MRKLFLLLLLTTGFNLSAQDTAGFKHAKAELSEALNTKGIHNVVDNKSAIIKDSLTAVSVAEPILFSIYGKEHIMGERPYEIYHIDNYWVLSGTLTEDFKGGTFLIIIDDRDSKVIRITHGK